MKRSLSSLFLVLFLLQSTLVFSMDKAPTSWGFPVMDEMAIVARHVLAFFKLPENHELKDILFYSVKISSTLALVNALKIGIQGGLGDAFKKVPGVFDQVNQAFSVGFNKICNRPNALTSQEVLVLEQIVEGMTTALCEQSASGNLMLRNIRVGDEGQEQSVDINWAYFVSLIEDVFEHVGSSLEAKLPYYTGDGEQNAWLAHAADNFSGTDKAGAAFLIKTIIRNLKHISRVCKKAESIDELDKSHIKKISRTTLLLFKKLRIMLDGVKKSNGNVSSSSMIPSYPSMPGGRGLL